MYLKNILETYGMKLLVNNFHFDGPLLVSKVLSETLSDVQKLIYFWGALY